MRIIALFVLFLPAVAAAQTFGGIGTRAEGMGGAFVAVADDASAMYWNPAGIATGASFDLQISRGRVAPGSTLFVGAAMPVLGLSFYRTHTVQVSPDRQNDGSGRVQIRTLETSNVGVTVVQTVVSGLVIGTTARLVRGQAEPFESGTKVDFDAGAMVSAGSLRVGITGRNLRRPEFEGPFGPVPMPRQVRLGAAFAPRALASGLHGPFSLAFDADLTRTPWRLGDLRMAALGGEYWLAGGRFGGRAGVRWNTLDVETRAISGGLRYLFQSLVVPKLLVRAKERLAPSPASVPRIPGPMVNSALERWFRAESALVGGLPFGSSVLAVARRV